MHDLKSDALSKVPQLTLAFWVIKILATTLGETGGDALSMQLNLGYLVSTLIFLGFFAATVSAQVASKRFHPLFYWACVVATTTVGTTTSDYFDRSLGLGYVKSSAILLAGVIVVLAVWRRTTGTIAADRITSRGNEVFYWITILVSNTLGTALGDFTADDLGLGFQGGAVLFAGLIALVAALHLLTRTPKAILFWAAYVLTRPLGATLGDTLTKPLAKGGFDLSRINSSLVIALIMVAAVWITERGQVRAQARASA
ncbi:MAG TPA: hypothetical protein VJS38_16475 [Phenylobacterium sp.]|uniref:COG4705 family protein n=1 Tax=Phenylobacterium sp. TaxID=1871053 RepID=UPI002B47A1E5|nr:hypothetical protein [Phenylobacterium sp.]HKR89767.1 hypothetical protein [Phenylobacterium sp.]